jgi:hypothetical protein
LTDSDDLSDYDDVGKDMMCYNNIDEKVKLRIDAVKVVVVVVEDEINYIQ